MIWDEHWYVFDANGYLGGNGFFGLYPHPEKVIEGDTTWLHPPLGKLLLATGVGPLPGSPWGWRLPPALFGIAGVGLVFLVGRRLWHRPWWAGLAGLLLCLDGLHIVQSRLAMLDIFMATFLLAAFLALLTDRARSEGEGPMVTAEGRYRERRWERALGGRARVLAGIAIGAAVATKWSAAFPVAFGVLWACWWTARTTATGRLRTIGRTLASLVVVPLVVYLAAYGLFFAQHGPDLAAFVELQAAMADATLDFEDTNPLTSDAISWPVMGEPLRYLPPHTEPVTPDEPRLLALGNPAVWYGAVIASPFLIWICRRRGAWRERLVLGFWLFGYLPWFAFGRSAYLYYMLPVVPFMCLGIVAVLHHARDRIRTRLAIGYAALVTLTGFAFLPLWLYLPAPWIRQLLWLPGWRA